MTGIDDLIIVLSKLPGIGRKTATRLSYFLLKEKKVANEISTVIAQVVESVFFCSICGNYTTHDPCSICTDASRDTSILCVIEDPQDLIAIEQTGSFNGQYHILMGALNPIEGVGPENLRIKELINRVNTGSFEEILIATNPTIDGEATNLFLQDILSKFNLKTSRIATGIPIGGNLEYTDKYTLGKAIQRKNYIKNIYE